MKNQCFVLMGFMGSGKTTLGRQLAKHWNWNFIDLDQNIEEKYGKPISQIFQDEGHEAFRIKERNALLDILVSSNRLVLSVGGGTPCFLNNMFDINQLAHSAYIRISVEELTNRLSRSKNPRPLIEGKTEAELSDYIREVLKEREPDYLKADHVIESDNLQLNDLLVFIPCP